MSSSSREPSGETIDAEEAPSTDSTPSPCSTIVSRASSVSVEHDPLTPRRLSPTSSEQAWAEQAKTRRKKKVLGENDIWFTAKTVGEFLEVMTLLKKR